MSQVPEPPPFGPVNVIELDSVADSTISGVSVYSSRAEITRVFKFNIATGQNQLHISGLPRVLDPDSLRSVQVKKKNTAKKFHLIYCLGIVKG